MNPQATWDRLLAAYAAGDWDASGKRGEIPDKWEHRLQIANDAVVRRHKFAAFVLRKRHVQAIENSGLGL